MGKAASQPLGFEPLSFDFVELGPEGFPMSRIEDYSNSPT